MNKAELVKQQNKINDYKYIMKQLKEYDENMSYIDKKLIATLENQRYGNDEHIRKMVYDSIDDVYKTKGYRDNNIKECERELAGNINQIKEQIEKIQSEGE